MSASTLRISRPLKRPRDEDSKQALTNHPSLYLDDGNLIIKCDAMLFCVHRTIMSKHSEVWRDLCARDVKPQDFFRGCPLVDSEDAADDMAVLLGIIYDGLALPARLTAENFPYAAAALRMTTKYRLMRQRAAVLDGFRMEWRAFPVLCASPAAEPHPAEVIALLRTCGYHSPDLLAPLFYTLSALAPAQPPTGKALALLAPADTERLLAGLHRLRRAHAAAARFPLRIGAAVHARDADAGRAAACQLDLLSFWLHVAEPCLLADVARPVEGWAALQRAATAQGIRGLVGGQAGACGLCKAALLWHIRRTAQVLREGLGVYFSLV